MSLISCSNLYVQQIDGNGLGVFTSINIKKGYIVEKGVIRRVDTYGNKNAYLLYF